MNHDAEDPTNLDYEAEGASVLEVHEAVQREKEEPAAAGMEPPGRWVTILSAVVIALGGGFLFSNSNGFSSSIYTTDYYRPDARPDLGGGVAAVEQLSWIDQWMKDGKKAYNNCKLCHGDSGAGVPGKYPPLASSEWVDGGTTRLGAILLNGVSGSMTVAGQTYGGTEIMPAWKQLPDKQIAQVLTYIRRSFGTLAEGDDGVITTEMMEAAREEFSGKSGPWSESELKAIPNEQMLPGAKVDHLTGQPLP